ncbi:MAG: hypothetical protein EOO29_23355, partial [Comamonadaceae bacterium]
MTTSDSPSSPMPLLERVGPLRLLAWAVTLIALPTLIMAPLTLEQQLVLSVGLFAVALVVNRFKGHFFSLLMMFLSVVVSARYMF